MCFIRTPQNNHHLSYRFQHYQTTSASPYTVVAPPRLVNETASISVDLFLLLLFQGFGLGLRFVRAETEKVGREHANLPLVVLVLGVFPSSDELREPGRPLEESDKTETRYQGPSIGNLCRDDAPDPQREPDALFDRKVGVPAPCPQARGYKASLQVIFRKALWHLAGRLVLPLRILEICFASVAKLCQIDTSCARLWLTPLLLIGKPFRCDQPNLEESKGNIRPS